MLDSLPSDVTGVSIYNQKTQEFEFRRGPVFAQISGTKSTCATPRTQSLLLEAMAEGNVSVDGNTYKLAQPFCVFATQNPVEHEGTCWRRSSTASCLADGGLSEYHGGRKHARADAVGAPAGEFSKPVTHAQTILRMQAGIRDIHVHEKVREYILRIVHRTRDSTASSGQPARVDGAVSGLSILRRSAGADLRDSR